MRLPRPLPLAALLLLGPGPARAAIPVELPPGEDPADWDEAVAAAGHVADLVLGPALGPGPSVRILAGTDHWTLDVATAAGRLPPVTVRPPKDEAARLDLLLVCTEALRPADPEPPARTTGVPPPGPHRAAEGPRLTVGIGASDPADLAIQGLLEPLSWTPRSAWLAPTVTVATPSTLAEGLTQVAGWVGLAGGWRKAPGSGAGLGGRVGADLALGIRTFQDGTDRLRDWTWSLGPRGAISFTSQAAWQVEVGARLLADLPPSTLAWRGVPVAVPTWHALATLGIRPPPLRSAPPPEAD